MTSHIVHGTGLVLLQCLILVSLSGCRQLSNDPELYTTTTDKSFHEVVEDLQFAITERNYRVVNTLQIGKAIRERGFADFPRNAVILYCNLTFAQAMLEEEPDYLNHCPARISVRENGATVLISAHLFPESGYNNALDEIIRKSNTHIREIVDFGARKWLDISDTSEELEKS